MSTPTIPLPRPVVDAVRVLQVVLVALTPFLPVSVAVQAAAAVFAALVPLLVVRQATTPVTDPVVWLEDDEDLVVLED